MTDNRKWQYSRFGQQSCHFRLLVVVEITWRHFCRSGHGRRLWICRWNFDTICHSPVLAAMSLFPVVGCFCNPDSFFELTAVENLRFVVGILIIYYRRHKYFQFGWLCCYFRFSVVFISLSLRSPCSIFPGSWLETNLTFFCLNVCFLT